MFQVKGKWTEEEKEDVYLVALMDEELPAHISDDDIFFYITEERELKNMVIEGRFLVDDFKVLSYERLS